MCIDLPQFRIAKYLPDRNKAGTREFLTTAHHRQSMRSNIEPRKRGTDREDH
jgi:hypothetical protein